MEVRYADECQDQRGDPESGIVREQGEEREDRDDFEMHLADTMRQAFRQRMQVQVKIADEQNDQDREDDHHVHQKIGLTGSRDEGRQVVRRERVQGVGHDSPPS